MYCPNCGNKVNDKDHFCMNCGHNLGQTPKPSSSAPIELQHEVEEVSAKRPKKKKKQKSCLGRLFSFLMLCCVLLIAFASIFGESPSNESANVSATVKPTSTHTAAATSNPTQKPTQKPTEKPTATPTVTPTEAPTPTAKIAKATLVTLAKNALKETCSSFSYSNIEGDETGFTISVAMDGLAFELAVQTELGKDPNAAGWNDVKTSMLSAYGGCKALLDSVGLTDAVLMINLVNDNNYDLILLSVYDGQIVYDALAK